ncbi:MAG TPA: histidine kinase N-terminal 7TM domain-containing protein [Longimicrobium sp.]|nr:histidine kinase N-terminal 7TM domain-containing protein [Longimicrobium sp.]
MAWQSTPFFIPLMVSALVCAGLGVFAIRHRGVTAASGFIFLMASSAWWSLCYALLRASNDPWGKVVLATATQAGAILVPLAWTIFALQYTHRARWLRPGALALLSAVPALTLVAVATNAWHHWFWTSFEPVVRAGRASISPENGPGFWLHVAYSWGLLSLSVLLLVLRALRSHHLYRRQAASLVFAAVVPWVGNVLHLSRAVTFPVNPMPLLFTFSGAVFFWAIFRLRLLDLVPVAREALVEEMPDGMVVLDEDGRVMDLNPAARELLELGPADVFGQPAARALAPLAGLLDAAPGAGSASLRVELGRDGARRVVDARLTPLRRHGSPTGGRLLLLRDITELERREGALAVQRAYLDQLFESAPHGIALLDAEDRVLDVNGEWSRLFGYTAREAVGHPINELVVGPERAQEAAALTVRVSGGQRVDLETVRHRSDGTAVDVHITGAPVIVGGEQVGTWGIYRDISQHKYEERVRLELLDRERAARADAEGAQRRAAFLADVGALLSASFDYAAGFKQLARRAVPELADYCLIDEAEKDGGTRRVAVAHADPEKEKLLLPDVRNAPDADPRRRPVLRVVRSGEPLLVPHITPEILDEWSIDERHRERFMQAGPQSLMIVPLTARGRTLGAITLASAGSGRRFGPGDLAVAEETARRAALVIDNARLYQEAREAVRARESVLGVVSHDLRNPLSGILLNAEGALTGGRDLSPDLREGLELIVKSAEAMERMIRDLLDVTRIEAGELRIAPEPTDAELLLREAVGMMAPLAGERQIALTAMPAPEPVEVKADRDRVLQVFSNLLGNALKFTPRGGKVTAGAAREKGEMRFWVRDTGPGIEPEYVERLWDRFWQAEGPARRLGAGLGLPIARGIVEAHGGKVWVESQPGAGATFHFTLALASEAGLSLS